MLTFLAGFGVGFVTLFALAVWRGWWISRRKRRTTKVFDEFQRATFDVQDYVAFCAMNRAGSVGDEWRRVDVWRLKVKERNEAFAAYLEELKG